MFIENISSYRYLPLLDVRPAELFALEQLPSKDKDMLLPLFKLRPWVGAKKLSSALSRIQKAFGRRPCFLELGEFEPVDEDKRRDVHKELDNLREATDGYANWVNFFHQEGNENFIPVVQLTEPSSFSLQMNALLELGRGVLIRIPAAQIDLVEVILRALPNGAANIVVVLDYGKVPVMFSKQDAHVRNQIETVLASAPNVSRVAFSASSFPDGFVNLESQEIAERVLFQKIVPHYQEKLIYSDRGSARAERQQGGGGLPAPRIDYAKPTEWRFFRQSIEIADATMGYQLQALALINSQHWDPRLKLWGCQMIEKTAIGDDTGIDSPNRSTAARINIHLHQQLWFGDVQNLYDTEEEWVD